MPDDEQRPVWREEEHGVWFIARRTSGATAALPCAVCQQRNDDPFVAVFKLHGLVLCRSCLKMIARAAERAK